MVQISAREIPVPTSVSHEAQAVLAMGRLGPPPRDLPALDDTEGWKAYVAETDGFVRSMVGDAITGFTGSIEERDIGPCPLYVVLRDSVRGDDVKGARPDVTLFDAAREPGDRITDHGAHETIGLGHVGLPPLGVVECGKLPWWRAEPAHRKDRLSLGADGRRDWYLSGWDLNHGAIV